jgi:hypothetical protein
MPGVASSQLKPSRRPVPVQPVHERSFSPCSSTHLPLRHWLSFEQKQPLGLVHCDVDPLQLPKAHAYFVATEFGQPPSGQGTLASEGPVAPEHAPLVQTPPSPQDAPHAPQLALSVR